ncbi:hypothetical protein MJN51_38630, partial [Salmonella enterica subsp. enterica serovar Kentucky]|nr:hypothetical protein [Salmonella enterica subsp. enterica serovar Kentucky]
MFCAVCLASILRRAAAAANWLRHTPKPAFANNHFLQGQWRNIARAQILLGEFEPAEIV